MSSAQHQFKPLDKPQIIPVHWVFSQNDYEKLQAGNEESRNHWHCFMDNNLFHIYKGFGGPEHYRFTLHNQTNGSYLVDELETHANPRFYEGAKLKGWTETEVDNHRSTLKTSTVHEVADMLSDFFGIKVR